MRLPPRSRLSRTEGRAGCPARPRHAALEQVCASPRPPWSSAGLKSWPGPSRGVLSCRLPWWPSGSDSGLPPQGVGWIPGQGSATPQALHSQEKATLKSTDMPGPPGGASGLPCRRRRDAGLSPGREDPLEEGMATHCSVPAWRVPWTQEPGPWGRKESDTTEAT